MKALVVRLSSLGDVILTTPVLRNLKDSGASVDVLVKRAFADALRGHPAVDGLLIFEDRGFWGWAAEVRRRGYDAYVDLHDTPRSRAWGWLSGIPRRTRYDKQAWPRRRLVRTKRADAALKSRVADRYLGALAALGVPAAARRTELFPGDAPLQPPLPGRGPFIGLAPGAQHATKRWLPERFAEAADRLRAGALPGATALLLGSAADAEPAAAVMRVLRAPALSYVGKTSVAGLLKLVQNCDLVLTNDSGVMHAAGALRRPTVAVFGSTVEAFGFFPEPDCSAAAQAEGLYCRPCALHGRASCPEGHFRCMRDVSVDQVVAAAEGLLKAAR